MAGIWGVRVEGCAHRLRARQVAGLQRSLQYGARVPAETARSLPACLARIWAAEGLRGLYKGALPSIIKAAPSAAVTLSAYELFLAHLAAVAAGRRAAAQGGSALEQAA